MNNRTIFSNFSSLALGNILSQALNFFGYIYIARLLGPEQYGMFNTALAFIGMFTLLTYNGINRVVLHESAASRDRMREVFESTIGLRYVFSVLAWVVCLIAARFMPYEQAVQGFIVIAAIELFLNGVRCSLNTIYQACEDMKYIAWLTIVRSALSVVMIIGVLQAGYGLTAVFWSQIGVSATVLTCNVLLSRRFLKARLIARPIWDWGLLKRGFSFTFLEFLNSLSGKIDLVMLSYMGTPSEVALYAVAYRLVMATNIIRGNLSQSLFPTYAKAIRSGKLSARSLWFLTVAIIMVSLVGAVFTGLLADWFVLRVFGQRYAESAEYLRVLVYFVVFSLGMVPFAVALQASYNERMNIGFSLVRAVLNVALNIVFYKLYGAVGIAYSSLVTFGISTCLFLSLGYGHLRRSGALC